MDRVKQGNTEVRAAVTANQEALVVALSVSASSFVLYFALPLEFKVQLRAPVFHFDPEGTRKELMGEH